MKRHSVLYYFSCVSCVCVHLYEVFVPVGELLLVDARGQPWVTIRQELSTACFELAIEAGQADQ